MSTLPKLNSDYKYQLTLPVTGTKHSYRPFLVGEEKALLMANETQEKVQMAIAMRDTLEACVEGLELDILPLADMEYAFTQVRARSAGETVPVSVECENCGSEHKATINLLEATVTDFKEYESEHTVELQPNWLLDLRWPSLASAINIPETSSEIEQAFGMIREMLVALRTPDGMYDFSDISDKEKDEFLESMNAEQMTGIRDFLSAMPNCKIDLDWTCPKCSTKNDTPLVGIQNFFV